jgi:hypothetical protein
MLCPLLSSPLGQEYKEDLALSSDLFSKWPLLEDPYEKHFVQVKTNDVSTNPYIQFLGCVVVELFEMTFIFTVIFFILIYENSYLF